MNPRAFISAGLLLAIFLAPTGGNPTVFAALENTLARLAEPVTEQEQGELNFLACVESVSLAIPDRIDTKIVGNQDSYLRQRAEDLMYPRVRLVHEGELYQFHIGNEAPPEGEITAQADCGGVVYTVVKNG